MVVKGYLESLEMASSSRTTTQEVPFQGVTFVFPPSEGIVPPFIATLNLPGLTIELPVWIFNSVIPVTPNVSNVTSPLREDRPQPNPSPSSLVVASYLSSSSLDQSSMVSSHGDKKKKGKGKKKKDKKEKKKQPSALDGAHSKRTPRKPKFPCKICKGDHLLKECLGLSRVQEEWSKRSKLSVSSTCDHHVDNTPSTSDPLVKGRRV